VPEAHIVEHYYDAEENQELNEHVQTNLEAIDLYDFRR